MCRWQRAARPPCEGTLQSKAQRGYLGVGGVPCTEGMNSSLTGGASRLGSLQPPTSPRVSDPEDDEKEKAKPAGREEIQGLGLGEHCSSAQY